ncbi:MAG: hypothetical protein RLY16_2506, partial [Bacteroidota bacterium]
MIQFYQAMAKKSVISTRTYRSLFLLAITICLISTRLTAQVYINGNLSTGAVSTSGAVAPAGTTWSEIQFGNGTPGVTASISGGSTIADNFTIACGSWNLTKFTFYAYADGYAGASSPFNDVRLRIYNTDPSIGSPTPIYGDLTTNRFSASTFANIYRITNGSGSDLTRKVWQVEATVATTLSAGTYWVEWQLGTAQPTNLTPLSTVVGTTTQAGNNAKRNVLPSTWSNITDNGAQDLPFRIDYVLPVCTGTPSPGNTLSTVASLCPGNNFTLSLQFVNCGLGETYQWQSSPDNISWSNIGGATNSTLTTAMVTSTYYRCAVTCSGNTGYSTGLQVLQNPPSACYCVLDITDCTDNDKIINVTFGSINNSSDCSPNGYANYVGLVAPTNVYTGVGYAISVTVPTNWNESIGIWIDYDHSGTFDATEFTVLPTGKGVRTGLINIPSSALTGLTTMRIRDRFSTALTGSDACIDYVYGETEDYEVNIIASAPCGGTPVPGNTNSTLASVCSAVDFTLSLSNQSALNTTSGLSYQWQSSPDGIAWTNISGATSNILVASQSAATYYRCNVSCGGNTGSSTGLQITMNAATACYCTPGNTTCSLDDEILNVTIGGINNSSSGCTGSGYTDYTGSVAAGNLNSGVNNAMSVTVGPGGTEYVGVWIDFDQNGTFDASEFTLLGSGNGVTISNNIFVPGTATAGVTRMRVRVRFNTALTDISACTSYTYGETEDYLVNIVAATPCSGTPNPGNTLSTVPTVCASIQFTLSLQNAAALAPLGGLTYQWQSSPDNITWTNISGATSPSLITTQTAATYYRANVTCAGNTGTSTALQVLLTAPASCYCIPGASSCSANDVITNVTFGTINNTTACSANGYGDYFYAVPLTTAIVGVANPISVTVGPGGTEYVNVWIDYDHSGTFDASEHTYIGSGNGVTISNSITIPVTALTGSTRMRVRLRWFTNLTSSDACTTYGTGETEDYQVFIGSCSGISINEDVSAAIVNCGSNTSFTIDATGIGIAYQWQYRVTPSSPWINVTNNATYSGATTNTLNLTSVGFSLNDYQYRAYMTSPCGNDSSSAAKLTVLATGPIVISTQPASVNITCSANTSFTVAATAGSTMTYQWQLRQNASSLWSNVANNATFSGATTNTLSITSTPSALSGYQFRVYINATCASSDTSSIATLTINFSVQSVTIASNAASNTACAGTNVIFTPTAVNTGATPFYTWYVNNINMGTGATYASSTLVNGDQVKAVLLSNTTGFCISNNPATSNVIPMTITATTPTSVSIAPNTGTTICAGASVTFTATPTNGGATPTYEFLVNGFTVQAASATATYTTNTLVNGDVVTCRMVTSATNCPSTAIATSAGVTMTVNPILPVSVSLASNNGTSICAATSVIFTATPTNGGATPSYEFFVNGFSVQGPSASATYTTSGIVNGDVVTCILTSSLASCTSGNPATSNALNMTVATPVPSVVLSPLTDVCPGSSKTFTAIPTNGGATPLYEFFVNGSSVQGPGASDNYTYVPANGDIIRVDLTSSLSCAAPATVTTSYTQGYFTIPTAAISAGSGLCPGQPVVLSANATAGSGTITGYQWKIGSSNIPGATASTYSTVTAGTYTVVVTNSNGCSFESANFVLAAGSVTLDGVYTIGTVTATASGASAGTTINVTNTGGLVVGQAVGVTSGSTTGVFANSIIAATAATATTTITVASTTGLVVGQTVYVSSGVGAFAYGTKIATIVNATSFTVTSAPTTPLAIGAIIHAVTTVSSITNGTQFVVSPAPTTALTAGATITGATCSNYLNITFAVSDLNNRSISNNVTFNVTPGFVENIAARLSLGNATLSTALATRSITFQKNGLGTNPKIIAYVGTGTPASAIPDGMWSINGLDNITIDGIDFQDNNTTNPATMDYAIGLFKLSATDGAQNNTIKNCVITLNRVNNVAAGANTVEGSVGIISVNATSTTATTAITPTAASGSNSNNKFYTNTIQNVHHGIALMGYAAPSPFTLGDTGNDIGGAISSNGNSILNYGGGTGSTLQSSGIRVSNQWGINVAYNTINNNNGSGVNHQNLLKGILAQATTSGNGTFDNNNITVRGGSAAAVTVIGIENAMGATAAGNTIAITNNTITGSYSTALAGTGWTGILNSATAANVTITGNTIQNVTNTAAAPLIGINNTAVVGTNLTVSNNTISGFAPAGTGTFTAINNTAILAAAVNFNNNNITNNVLAGVANFLGINSTTALSGTINVNNNVITGNSKSSTGNLTGINLTTMSTSSTLSLNGNNISSNTITGGAAACTLIGINQTGGANYNASSNIISNNSITAMSGTAVASLSGYVNNGGLQNETVSNNQIFNQFVTGTSTGLHIIRGIFHNTSATSPRTISGNIIHDLYSNAGSSAQITGIYHQLGGVTSITKNQVYNLFPGQNGATSAFAKGIWVATSGTGTSAVTIANNMISLDLTLASGVASNNVLVGLNSVIGIDIAPTATTVLPIGVYYNTVRLAGGGTGTAFGSSAMNMGASTAAPTLDIRNNILVNLMTPGGAVNGVSVALRKSNALATYNTSSNNNVFYAGTPSASNLLYYDGTNKYQTMATFIAGAGISPRESASLSVLPEFTNVATPDLTLTTSNCLIDGAGSNTGIGIVDDFGATAVRAATGATDIGADEFTGLGAVTLTVNGPITNCLTVDLTDAAITAGSTAGSNFTYWTDLAATSALATPANVTTSGTYYIKSYIGSAAGSCYSTVQPIAVTITPSGTWLGLSTAWSDANNWCGGLPTAATDVTIPTTANNPIITDLRAVRDITFTGTGALTVNVGGTIQIGRTLSASANKITANGIIEFNGTAAQTLRADYFTGNTLNTLKVSNTHASGLAIDIAGGMLNVTNEVLFGAANNQLLNTNNLLTLRSTATATARVADVTSGGVYTGNNVSGKVVIERYLNARRAWRLLTAPIKSSTVPTPTIFSNWQEGARSYPLGTLANPNPGYGTHITNGNNLGNYDQNINSNSSIFYLTTTGWNGKPTNTSGTTIGGNNGVITDQPAYFVFVRGDRSIHLPQAQYANPTVTTLRVTGLINVTSDASTPLSLTGSSVGNGGFYSFGNPYPSAISFESIRSTAANSGLPNVFYVWDPYLGGSSNLGAWVTVNRLAPGSYVTAPNTPSLNTGVIQSGMGFMMAYSGSVSYLESQKVSGSSNMLYRPANNLSTLRTNLLTVESNGNESVSDGVLAILDPAASDMVDKEDGIKNGNFSESISMVRNTNLLSIE